MIFSVLGLEAFLSPRQRIWAINFFIRLKKADEKIGMQAGFKKPLEHLLDWPYVPCEIFLSVPQVDFSLKSML
jgi:hypothetical protein